MIRTSVWILSLAFLVLGCSGNKDGDKSPADESKAKQLPVASDVGPDWSKRQIAPVSAVVDGVAFTVSLPDKLKQEIKKSDGTYPGYVTWTDAVNPLDAPVFTVQLDTFPPSTLEQAARSLMGMKKDRTVTVKEKLTDGFLVAAEEPSKKFLHVQVWRFYPKGAKGAKQKVVHFSIVHRTSAAMPHIEPLRAWFIKVARSFEVTPKAAPAK